MQSYQLFIGIDISKKTIDVSVSPNGSKSQMPHACFENKPSGFKSMLDFIKTHQNGIKKNNCFFCMEHTGVYTFLLCNFLQKHGLAYTLVSPHHLSKSLGLRRGKNDKADSKDITRYAYLFREELKPSVLISDTLLTIKSLLGLRRRLVNAKKGLTTAANELRQFAKPAIYKPLVEQSNKLIRQNEKAIEVVENKIKKLIEKEQELQRLFDLVTSVKGVGFVIAAHLLVYTNQFKGFENAKQFACYIGVAPFEKSSGTSVYVPAKVSHMAHKKLKGVISNGASIAILYDKELKAFYDRKIKEGKNKHVVRNAVTNKLIHRVFAVVKRGSKFIDLFRHKA